MKKRTRIFLVVVAFCVILPVAKAQQNKAEQLYQQALFEMEGKGDYAKAIESFTLVMTKFPKEKATAAKALLNIGRCYEKLGKSEAIKAYERILKEFKDQPQIVAEARTRLATLKQSTEEVMHQSQITNRQIWAGKDVDTEGAPSPDGQYLSYTDSKKNSLAIYNVKTGERKVLGNPGADRHMGVNESVWSPDSKQLAYGLIDEDHGIAEIQLVNVDNAIHRKLCSADPGNSYIWVEDWSKDGLTILAVFQNLDGSDSKIALVSVADGSVRFVKTMSNWNWGLSHKLFFSPDGRFIAYSSLTEKKSKSCDVFVIAIDGTNEINITQHPDDDRVLGWDPDGSRLLFASNRGGGYSIWVIPIVNGQPQEYPKLVKDNIGKISPMGLTSDGSLYYSVTSAKESNIYLASIDSQTGKIVSQPKAATMQNNGFNHSFAWSPDGKKLLYLSDFFRIANDNWNKTFMLTPETGLEKRVVSQIASDTVIAYNWFPDGKHLAVVGLFSDGSKGICKLNIQNGKLIPILTSKSKDTTYWFPSVSPDGKTIFTHAFLMNNQSIYSYDIEKKEKKLLFQSGKDRYIYSVRLSSDGKQLAFILMTIRPEEFPALMVMSSSGGEATAIYRNKIPGQFGNFAWYYGLDWSPDGQYIYFAKRPDSVSPYELLRIPVQGGSPEQIGVEMEGLHCISIRPDGKQIAFSAGADPKQEIWVLENIFADDRNQQKKLSGPITRRILEDATDIGDVLTADGKYIRSLDENTGDILQFEISSGDTTRINNKSKWDEKEKTFQDVVFSHDGKQIVYNIEVFDKETKCWGYPLQIRNLDGSNLRTLYTEKGSYYLRPLDWSPDGSSVLVFLSHKNKIELAQISIADSSLHIIKNFSPGWQQFQIARFSPDGKFIAMNKIQGGNTPNSDLIIITADGRNEYVIAEHSAEDQLIAWTPDGRSLIFFSDRTGTWDIWITHITDGKQLGEPELLKKDFGWDTEVLGFVPDGSLFYKTPNSIGKLFTGSIDIETGKILTPPSQAATRYTSPPVQTIWSPDGKNLAYISRWNFMHPGNSRLTIRSEATGKERFLTPGLRFVNQISWAPDGKSIIALGLEETSQGIYQIDVETSEIKKLTDEGVAPRLCPDGKNLLFVKGGPIIMKRNLETGETSEIVKIKGMNYDLSPDGSEIVFQVDSLVKIISTNGGESRELFLNSKVSPKWTKDGRFIIVGAKGSLWRIPAQGGTPLKLDLAFPKMQFLTFHPDNSRFAFCVTEESISELWVMENFLPKEDLSLRYTKPMTREIWSGPEVDNLGAPSPDGNNLSFTDWETGDLAIRNLESGEKRRLTNKGSWEQSDEFSLYSIFSPDGKRLAYNWYNKNNFFEIRLIASDGSGERVLLRDDKSLYVGPLDWSKDGKQILILSEDYNYNYRLIIVSSEDGSQRILKQFGSQSPTKAFFSNDGKNVVYDFPQSKNSSERDIIILSTEGSKEIQIVKHPADDYLVGFTPDGKKIIFASDRTGVYDLWSVQITDDSKRKIPEILKKDAGSIWPMGLSNKGSLYYSLKTGSEEVYIAKLDLTKGVLLSPPEKLIRRFSSGSFSPAFSPDGNFVAYVSEIGPSTAGGGRRILCIRSLKTGEEREITPKLNGIGKLKWSPDGRYLLLTGQNEKKKHDTYRIDIKTNEIVLVRELQADENIRGQIWSFDGKAIFFIVIELKKNLYHLMMKNIETGKENELYRTEKSIYLARMCLSPDGTKLVFTTIDAKNNHNLNILSSMGGEPKIILSIDERVSVVPITWTADGKNILFVKSSGNNQEPSNELFSISADGGEPQKLSFPLKLDSVYELIVSPDGQHIAYTAGKQKNEIWVMENFLPKEKK